MSPIGVYIAAQCLTEQHDTLCLTLTIWLCLVKAVLTVGLIQALYKVIHVAITYCELCELQCEHTFDEACELLMMVHTFRLYLEYA